MFSNQTLVFNLLKYSLIHVQISLWYYFKSVACCVLGVHIFTWRVNTQITKLNICLKINKREHECWQAENSLWLVKYVLKLFAYIKIMSARVAQWVR